MDLGISAAAQPLLAALREYIADKVLPAEARIRELAAGSDRWQPGAEARQLLEDLKAGARQQGLWNLFLTDGPFAEEPARQISTVDYAWLAEAMGQSVLAPEVFNCNAPDSGNMEVLARYGSAEQQERWLKPLLAGEIRSAYAMTEPGVASSDATNIAMQARADGDHWLINGRKTFISGAGDPRCKILICMVLSDPEAERYQRHSQILVPMDTPGVRVERPMTVLGVDDAPHGHMLMSFENVRVPLDHVILGRGRGFEIAQGRLGPGRVHHCMRAIGMAEKALELMCQRAAGRTAFGKPLARLGGNMERLAEARMQVDMARLLTLRCAWEIDQQGAAASRGWISKIKSTVPNIVLRVIDDAMQMHGAVGLSDDTPLAEMYAHARSLRLADGPDEVHRMVVARELLQPYWAD